VGNAHTVYPIAIQIKAPAVFGLQQFGQRRINSGSLAMLKV
jgi:hypothetical protein